LEELAREIKRKKTTLTKRKRPTAQRSVQVEHKKPKLKNIIKISCNGIIYGVGGAISVKILSQ